jgi:ribosomal protein L11 methylase PrmA
VASADVNVSNHATVSRAREAAGLHRAARERRSLSRALHVVVGKASFGHALPARLGADTGRAAMWRKLLNKLVPQSARKGVFEPFVCEQYTHRVGAACLELKAMSDQPVQLMDSGDDTGFGVWGSSLVLANLLENDAVQRQRLDNATVIELGSGTGLVGLACAALAAKTVVLTGERSF